MPRSIARAKHSRLVAIVREIRDELEPYAAIAHPGANDVEVVVGFGLLVAGVGAEHEIGSFASGVKLDQQCRAVHADPVGKDIWRGRQRHG